mmetsp:Transcript_16350/g.19505  ORF Transcript_16350/g.19505 Transcript_16350/m.19505 type:complete len:120 (+) Transcript_16350:173-532(+)
MDEKDYPPLDSETSRFFSLNVLNHETGNLYSRDSEAFEHPGYQQSRSSYNALRQDFAIAKAQSERVIGFGRPKLDLMAKARERQNMMRGESGPTGMKTMSLSPRTDSVAEKIPLLPRKA